MSDRIDFIGVVNIHGEFYTEAGTFVADVVKARHFVGLNEAGDTAEQFGAVPCRVMHRGDEWTVNLYEPHADDRGMRSDLVTVSLTHRFASNKVTRRVNWKACGDVEPDDAVIMGDLLRLAATLAEVL